MAKFTDSPFSRVLVVPRRKIRVSGAAALGAALCGMRSTIVAASEADAKRVHDEACRQTPTDSGDLRPSWRGRR